MATREKKPARGKSGSALEEELKHLREIAEAPITPESRDHLHQVLRKGQALAVAKAGRILKENLLEGFTEDLAAAFQRFMTEPVKLDPGCNAKLAVLEALDALSYPDPDLFLVAARHVQKEAAWGPPVDTASNLRGSAMRALANMGYADLLLLAGEHLADPEIPVRQAAAESLVHHGDRLGAGMLIHAMRRGDEDPVVHTAYLAGALALAPAWAMPYLKQMLEGSDPELRELAAIALGESSRDDAAQVLVEFLEATPLARDRSPIVKALGLHRSDRALEALVSRITGGPARDAMEALEALAIRRFESRVRERVRDAVRRSGEPGLLAAFEDQFPPDD